jgi:hypothetical protein
MYQLLRFFLTDRDLLRSVHLAKNCSTSETLGLDEKQNKGTCNPVLAMQLSTHVVEDVFVDPSLVTLS